MARQTFQLLRRFNRTWTVVMRTRIPIRAMIRLRHLLVLTHKPEHVTIERRMFGNETIRSTAVLEHNLAAVVRKDELVAFSGEFELLAVRRSVDTRVIRRVLHLIKRRPNRRVRQRFAR